MQVSLYELNVYDTLNFIYSVLCIEVKYNLNNVLWKYVVHSFS